MWWFLQQAVLQENTTQDLFSHDSLDLQVDLSFIKPVQTGYPSDSDARLVVRLASSLPLHSMQNFLKSSYNSGKGG